jgi:hypothetical protein
MTSDSTAKLKADARSPLDEGYIVIPGLFYFLAGNQFFWVANGGGGQSEDGLADNIEYLPGVPIGDFKKFTLWYDGGSSVPTQNSYFAIQTYNGNYLTAENGGGLTTRNAITTVATQIQAWQQFAIRPVQAFINNFSFTVQTFVGNYLTAVGGGAQYQDAFHTDATKASTWETFVMRRTGSDLGSGLQYYIVPSNGGLPLIATNGGGMTRDAIRGGYVALGEVPPSWGIFTLVKQGNGAYTIQTANNNFVTAADGGGLAGGTPVEDTLQTDRTVASAWEMFRFVDRLDGTYSIQVDSGFYIGPLSGPNANNNYAIYATNISDVNMAQKFLIVMSLL